MIEVGVVARRRLSVEAVNPMDMKKKEIVPKATATIVRQNSLNGSLSTDVRRNSSVSGGTPHIRRRSSLKEVLNTADLQVAGTLNSGAPKFSYNTSFQTGVALQSRFIGGIRF